MTRSLMRTSRNRNDETVLSNQRNRFLRPLPISKPSIASEKVTRRDSNARDTGRLSIVIPCWNEARHIGSLLEALDQQDCPGFEIVVVDEQSTDSTPDIVRQYAEAHPDLRLKLIPYPHRSIPAGLNLGIQHASGEIIMRLDGHSRPAPSYVSRCLATLEESGAAVVGGGCDIRPGAPGLVAQAIALAVSSPLGAGDALYRLRSAHQQSDVETVAFGCFHRRTWEAMGGYNENLLSNEDYEYNLRVRLRGGRVPSACGPAAHRWGCRQPAPPLHHAT